MEIKIEELEKFANDSKNNIQIQMCNVNALKVQEKYGGDIYSGNASYYNFKDKKIYYTKGHMWNVLNANTTEAQIIDIYNYKENREYLYFGYVGSKESLDFVKSTINNQ